MRDGLMPFFNALLKLRESQRQPFMLIDIRLFDFA